MAQELSRIWLLSVDLVLQLRGKVDLHLNRPVWANRLKCDFRKSVLDVTSWVRLINIFHVMHQALLWHMIRTKYGYRPSTSMGKTGQELNMPILISNENMKSWNIIKMQHTCLKRPVNQNRLLIRILHVIHQPHIVLNDISEST